MPSPLLKSFALASLTALSAISLLAVDQPRAWPPDQFLPVTLERISALPAADQAAWKTYFEASQKLATSAPARSAPEFSPLKPIDGPPVGGSHSRGLRLNAPSEWYAKAEAHAIADRIVEMQSPVGGWTKGNDYTQATKKPAKNDVWSAGTLDNDATTWEMRFLGLAAHATQDDARAKPWRDAFVRGVSYLLAAQYPNGGFPQIYPLVGGYHDAITYNDDAMVQALELLRDIAAGKPEYAFVPNDLRQRCGPAVDRGIQCILATQLKVDGKLIGWCQQYDALTQKPCAARNFEPICACTNESAGLVKFLLSLPRPSAEIVASVDGATAWFERVAIHGEAWVMEGGQHKLADRTGSTIWARYYEIGTDKPIFGDRDRTIHYAVQEISSERRNGYAWYGNWPAPLLERYQAWKSKLKS